MSPNNDKLFGLVRDVLDNLLLTLPKLHKDNTNRVTKRLLGVYRRIEETEECCTRIVDGLVQFTVEPQVGMQVHYIHGVGKQLSLLGLLYRKLSIWLRNHSISAKITAEIEELKNELQAIRSPSPQHFPKLHRVEQTRNAFEGLLTQVGDVKTRLREYILEQFPSTETWFRAITLSKEEWMDQSISYFQELGFLRGGAELSGQSVASIERLLKTHRYPEKWGYVDQSLLRGDTARVWCEDWEISFSTEDAYIEAVSRWSTISRGIFQPTNISFEWTREDDVFEVSFVVGGKPFSHRTDLTGWISSLLLHEINELIQDSGIRLYGCDTGDQTAFVVALTLEEKEKLAHERGWRCY